MNMPSQQYDFVYRKASYPLWLAFGINKAELRMLGEVSWYLHWKGVVVASQEGIMNELSGNSRERAKMAGYFEGLLRGGFIAPFEYVSQPGSMCVGLTALGVKVLVEFDKSISVVSTRYSRPFNGEWWTDATEKPLPRHFPKTAA